MLKRFMPAAHVIGAISNKTDIFKKQKACPKNCFNNNTNHELDAECVAKLSSLFKDT